MPLGETPRAVSVGPLGAGLLRMWKVSFFDNLTFRL